jgi:putative ABC transport system ATP-binding protein
VSLLEARAVEYRAGGLPILSGVDVTVDAGHSLAVTGPSGSGKTTLLGILAGLLRPTAGEVLVGGEAIATGAPSGAGVAVVLQGYGLVSLLTAAENVEVAVRAAGVPVSAARSTARQSLADVGLEEYADHLVEELSGGQQQRTAVARALAVQPRLLIADEPTAELDPAARALVLARLFEAAGWGGALILATHDPEVAARCDAVLEIAAPA